MRTGLASRGSACSFSCACQRSSSLAVGLLMIALSSARLAAYFLTIRARLRSRSIMETFAMFHLLPEREAECFQQRATFLVGLRRGRDGNVQPPDRIDLVVLDLREDDLLADPQAVIAATIERARVDSAEVADAGHRDVDQPVQELVHALPTQRYLTADRPTIANAKAGNRLAGERDHGLLPGDQRHVPCRVFQHLPVTSSLTDPHVQGDLGNFRHLHHVAVAKSLPQRWNDLLLVKFLQPRHADTLCVDELVS